MENITNLSLVLIVVLFVILLLYALYKKGAVDGLLKILGIELKIRTKKDKTTTQIIMDNIMDSEIDAAGRDIASTENQEASDLSKNTSIKISNIKKSNITVSGRDTKK